MKILFYGNCQTQALKSALHSRNPKADFEYAGNSFFVKHYDPERTEKLFDWCDHIVTQPVMNTDNADFHTVLAKRFEGKITFTPYIYLDGTYSLSGAPSKGRSTTGVVGDHIVMEALEQTGFNRTFDSFRRGEIDFKHRERLDKSFAELERREAFTHVKVAPYLRATYQDFPTMITHNHPHPAVINNLAMQIADRLGLRYKDIVFNEVLAYASITLPEFGKVLSPYTAMDLGLKYAPDLHWLKAGRQLIAQIAKVMGVSTEEKLRSRPAGKRGVA